MKKTIIIFAALLFINVNAEKIFEKETLNYYEETSTLRREEIMLYNNYYIEESFNGYLSNENIKENDIVDYDDYITEIHQSEEINGKTIYNFSDLDDKDKTVRFIRIYNMSDTLLEDVKIYYDENLIEYKYLYDIGNFNEKLNKDSSFFFDLKTKYDINRIKISIKIKTYKDIINVNLSYSNNLYYHQSKKEIVIRNKNIDVNHVIKFNSLEDKHYYQEEIRHYNVKRNNKVYTGTYTSKPLENHFLDKEDSKKGYNYYKVEEKPKTTKAASIKKNKTNPFLKAFTFFFAILIDFFTRRFFRK